MPQSAHALPPPRPARRDRRYTVHLSAEEESDLLRLAESRGEPPGRVATLLVISGAAALAPEAAP